MGYSGHDNDDADGVDDEWASPYETSIDKDIYSTYLMIMPILLPFAFLHLPHHIIIGTYPGQNIFGNTPTRRTKVHWPSRVVIPSVFFHLYRFELCRWRIVSACFLFHLHGFERLWRWRMLISWVSHPPIYHLELTQTMVCHRQGTVVRRDQYRFAAHTPQLSQDYCPMQPQHRRGMVS